MPPFALLKPIPLTRFHASTALDPLKLSPAATEIAKEIVEHLVSKYGCKVNITLDIEAVFPADFDEATIRTIRENANALRFAHHEFETGS